MYAMPFAPLAMQSSVKDLTRSQAVVRSLQSEIVIVEVRLLSLFHHCFEGSSAVHHFSGDCARHW
jgi:hypothetical protein